MATAGAVAGTPARLTMKSHQSTPHLIVEREVGGEQQQQRSPVPPAVAPSGFGPAQYPYPFSRNGDSKE